MITPELKNYIKEHLKTQSFKQMKEDLLKVGWPEEDLKNAFNEVSPPIKKWKIISVSVAILFVLIGLYAYFFIISPAFVSKPNMEKPEMNMSNDSLQQGVVKSEHLIFLLNEMGAYKLHNSITGGKPLISFSLNNQQYYFTIKNNNIIPAVDLSNPDIKIETDSNTVIQIYNSTNIEETVLTNYNNGNIKVQLLTDIATLALKGYKSLYDYFGITGSVIRNFFGR